ncbi:hypothetical protein L226DRAFT_271877 [Lentinus tigrinus ALCF2SS1-7]|uniref:uncharacterized protein n=1 Tax=Lentinus tigrinus ALCF2SS1-7 TaxID=1328758 RepID=UPI0011663BAA|nr:hypothetical protein L226DRAFT_271877 [Lentinus tigrinus ALCF2SS1-7]
MPQDLSNSTRGTPPRPSQGTTATMGIFATRPASVRPRYSQWPRWSPRRCLHAVRLRRCCCTRDMCSGDELWSSPLLRCTHSGLETAHQSKLLHGATSALSRSTTLPTQSASDPVFSPGARIAGVRASAPCSFSRRHMFLAVICQIVIRLPDDMRPSVMGISLSLCAVMDPRNVVGDRTRTPSWDIPAKRRATDYLCCVRCLSPSVFWIIQMDSSGQVLHRYGRPRLPRRTSMWFPVDSRMEHPLRSLLSMDSLRIASANLDVLVAPISDRYRGALSWRQKSSSMGCTYEGLLGINIFDSCSQRYRSRTLVSCTTTITPRGVRRCECAESGRGL